MPVPNITPLPPAPIRSKYSDEFAQKAEDFVSALPQFSQEMNDAAVFVEDRAAEVDTAQQATAASEAAAEGYRDEAEDYKNAAAATVNFVGKWMDLTGALAPPAVVYHDSVYWNLLNSLADVTTSEPAVTNSDWLKVYEVAPQNNLTATVDPTVNDDQSQGYGPTSRWINTNTGEFWLCISAAPGAANWQPATLTVDELGSAALAEVGTGAGQLPRNQDLGSAAQAEIGDFAPITRSRKNLLINGGFDVWQRGDPITISGSAYTSDRWAAYSLDPREFARQGFVLGQADVEGNPRHYMQVRAGTTVAEVSQRVEGVRTLSGTKAVVTFHAKADSAFTLELALNQNFGTGGTPSATVSTSLGTFSISTAWQKFVVVVDVPSITGKTLGTDGNDYLQLKFGSGSNNIPAARVFDLAQVQLEQGDTATDFEYRPIGEELALCQRYFQTSIVQQRDIPVADHSGNKGYGSLNFYQTMRGAPACSFTSLRYFENAAERTISGFTVTSNAAAFAAFSFDITNGTAGNVGLIYSHWTADAEL